MKETNQPSSSSPKAPPRRKGEGERERETGRKGGKKKEISYSPGMGEVFTFFCIGVFVFPLLRQQSFTDLFSHPIRVLFHPCYMIGGRGRKQGGSQGKRRSMERNLRKREGPPERLKKKFYRVYYGNKNRNSSSALIQFGVNKHAVITERPD